MITVLTVTFNQLDKLKKLYKSLLKQKKYVKEWIVYDDRSKDETIKWLRSTRFPFPIKVIEGIKREKPLVVANMNECMREVSDGVFIMVFADTYLKDDALKNLSESYIPGSFGSAFKINVDEKGRFISNHYHNIDINKPFCVMGFPRPWEQMSGNGMIATREIMESINYIDEEYGGYGIDDYDTGLRAMMNGAILYVYTNVKLYHIDHPTKNTTEDNKKRYEAKIKGEGLRL